MDDLIGEFITETSESLSLLDSELVNLEQNPNDSEILGNIFRIVHTIKGTCGFLGLPRLESVAHSGENVLGKIRDKEIEVSPEAVSIILDCLDCIKSLMEHLENNGAEPEGDDSEIIKRLNDFAERGGVLTPVATAPLKPVTAESSGGLVLPETEGGLSKDVLDELERLFNETPTTVDGGVSAPVAETPAPAPSAPAPAPISVAKDVAKDSKEKAIKHGLDAEVKDTQGGGANQSIRVNLDVLENLMQMVGELVLTRNQLLQIIRNNDSEAVVELKAPLQRLSHITTELQEGVMKTRMQPIGNAWAKFPRLIRDLSIDLGKKIELRMVGAETELDRQLLEMIKDPLTHMVRNSCDHGLEMPEQRAEAGKPETGTVTLHAFHEGGHIIIEISDDGRGVNIDRVKQKAAENGLASEEEISAMSDQQILQFIFKPGFSTAEKVTSVSGRGVGMDVVRTNIEKIGGTVELASRSGKGSTFHIKIPLTLAIVSVLIVESDGQCFAIPQINVLELVRSAEDSEYKIENIRNSPVLRLRDKLLPLIDLSQTLRLDPLEKTYASDDDMFDEVDEDFIVVCRVGGNDFGVIVDRIYDTEEIVVKPVSQLLKDITVFSGNTILGDGSVIMILDPNGLAKIVGESENSSKSEAELLAGKASGAENYVSFLLFKAGDGAPKAVPLELVSRLEEIDAQSIEMSGDSPVIQYRGELMRLTSLSNMPMPIAGLCEVIVFTYDGKTVGLVAEEIIDIVEAPLKVKLSSDHEAYLGSMVISGKTTDVVDVGYVLRDMIKEIELEELGLRNRPDQCHLMLVEDSIFFRKLTVPFLTDIGYKVTAYPSAMDALEVLEAGHKFDVIITDIEMPQIDGFEFAEKLRRRRIYDHIPIIAFTSTINEQFISRSREIGMNDFILKTDRETLIKSIEMQLNLAMEHNHV